MAANVGALVLLVSVLAAPAVWAAPSDGLPTLSQLPESPDAPSEPPFNSPSPTSLVQVRQLEVRGSTIFGPEILNPIVQPLQGRTVSLQELSAAVDAISRLYAERGYITSRAVLDFESLNTETTRIQVIEGGIEEIRVEGTQRLNPNYVRRRIQLGTGRPLNTSRLEEQLRLLKIDPLLESVEASLQAGTGVGQSILIIQVIEAKPFNAEVGFNNYSSPSIAPQQVNVALSYQNLTGVGDEIAFGYGVGLNLADFPRAALNLYDASYRLPLNPLGGALQLRTFQSSARITDRDFAAFGIRSRGEFYEINYRQPLIRSLREEFALSLGFTVQDSQTFLFENFPNPFGIGPDENGFSRTRVLRFSQDYVRRDTQGAWALQSQVSLGLGILDATENPGSIPDGEFFSWLGQVQRFQQLGNDYQLIVRGALQLTPDPLLPSQQFFLGGGQALRGYRPNVRAGDNGLSLSVEGRIPVLRNALGDPTLQLAPFVETGYVWNTPDNPNFLQGQRLLGDIGLGILWQPLAALNLRLDFALPFVDIEDRRDSLQDDGIYFSVSYGL
ncbi:ShlB/FhaC/HecB family hemolysin secretion/activation protein [Leptolyngbya sp. FACHB-261]|uniref:ShlB/FhaC/HecB family hemolysin secretion/activation protein n=1 Tax=Leptolyngbya sp. FACHB-261 TaxID=2692806 RepID=UPI0016885974|nr:ShlB/FhaC/HecB family hemolysin secretion/activation protein [Leptolyngbya sp. FACHB-261]MBD2103058.1 ShlB/FhaC/HecB family hemolysin secretion/activation protein [Leptolyngbya sp. FACHB-261]